MRPEENMWRAVAPSQDLWKPDLQTPFFRARDLGHTCGSEEPLRGEGVG